MSSLKKKALPMLAQGAEPAGAGAEPAPTAGSARPRFWRSFAELDNTPEFRASLEREFAAPPADVPPNAPERRRFMQLMGASLGLAGVGCRWQEDKMLPLTRRPEGTIPGSTKRYATAMELDGVAVGLHATSYDGRPIKIEGNPLHPESLGGASAVHQASVLGVYDPDRSDKPWRRGAGGAAASDWTAATTFLNAHFAKVRGTRGYGLRVLAERSSSPTLELLKQRFTAAFPQARWVTYEAASSDGARAGSVLAFGKPHRAVLRPEAAQVLVTLDADLFAPDFPGHLALARSIAKGRSPDGAMNRIYAIETGHTLVGTMADHRIGVRAEQVKTFAAALDAKVSALAKPLPELGDAQPLPKAELLSEAHVAKLLDALAKDLVKNIGKSLVVAGPSQPAEVHALAHRLNAVLGNVGRTVTYVEDPLAGTTSDIADLKQLADELNKDRVDTLLVLGGNPAYTAPGDLGFDAALGRAKTSIHLSLYDDETSQRCTWHLNAAHYLESWGDARAWDGTISLVQPLIAPIYDGRSSIELLSLLLGETAKPLDLVKATHRATLPDERAFRKALHDGVVAGSAYPVVTPALVAQKPLALDERAVGGKKLQNGQLEVTFGPCLKVYDGRFGNLGWLQELPEPLTKMTWDNAALFAPATAEELGVADGEPVTVTLGGKSVTLPAMWVPGRAEGSVHLALGYGRTAAGQVGGHAKTEVTPVGANAYALRTVAGYQAATGGSAARSNASLPRLSATNDIYNIDKIGHEGAEERAPELVREATLAEYKKDPHFVDTKEEPHPPLLSLWVPPVSYEGHKWGMAIDLNKCTGCSACITACQAENNIPVVGKTHVAEGREMLWLRVDRYYQGEPESAQVTFQPIPCQQCENAPCEQVCPVGATMHSREGLNDMVYNRCIGTRYCSNNCPYKVRRFNFFNYNVKEIGITPYTPTDDPKMKVKSMVFNPEVTVRSRGVMEKCTFCVQRIQNAKIKSKNVKQGIPDGTIRTACQETCPADAIVFGDLNDSGSQVAAAHQAPRAYALLGGLNNYPRVRYLGRVRNPNPELG
ncbi:MAG TPA: TAT-variant-translocated molybdopterin oxidoreductase [Polyangiaceae bacterium]|nr:TAT-variant-translocated molybdopterin oxidoreductase [Polyangiaceae bacterium]